MSLLLFIIVLSIVVLIHEFGHFIVAKKLKIKVEEFGFGFPPKLFSRKRGETEYSFNALPIGGFVKLYGEDEAGAGRLSLKEEKKHNEDEKRAFFARPIWQRVAVVVAGVVMNTLLAIVVFYIFMFISGFKTQLPLLTDHKFFGAQQENKTAALFIVQVVDGSPAAEAGIKAPSQVVSVNGRTLNDSGEFINVINQNKGEEVTFVLQGGENNERYTVTAIPRENPPKGRGSTGCRS
jgi:regulator of sigma E protease